MEKIEDYKYHAIGEKYKTDKGGTVECVEGTCAWCYYKDTVECRKVKCAPFQRKDCKTVKFIKI